MRRLLIIGLAMLGSLGGLLAGLSPAAADEPGLSLWRGHLDLPDCTVGRTFTVQWRAREATDVVVDGVAREGEEGEAEIECGPAPAGWELRAARYGVVPRREVAASARGADGELLTAALSVPMRAPIPPPEIVSVWARPYGSIAFVTFARGLHLRNERVRLLVRWRDASGGNWRGGVAYTDTVYTRLGESEPREGWVRGYTITPGTYEFQAVYGEWQAHRYKGNLPEDFEWGYFLHRDQIEWSDSAFITLADELPRFIAETAPDSITVRLTEGIEVDDVEVMLVERDRSYQGDYFGTYRDFFPIAADDTGASGAMRWSGLEPATDYVLFAGWRDAEQRGFPLLLDLRTEPAPPGFEPSESGSDRLSATVHADRIVLEWDAPAGAEDAVYSAAVYRYGTLIAAAERTDLRGPSHRIALAGLEPGSAYEVVVRREREEGVAFESRLVVETEPSAAPPPAAGDIDPPMLSEPKYRGTWRLCSALPPELSMKVVNGDAWEHFEYEWTLDGRSTRWRHTEPRLDLIGIRLGRYEIRARGFRDGVWSPWSDWTIFPRPTQSSDEDELSDPSENGSRAAEAPQPEPAETPEYDPIERWMPPVDIETIAATTEGVHIGWNCLDHITAGVHRVRTSYIIRWREIGHQAWTHVLGENSYVYPHCHHKLTGLRPGASYELGVAAYFSDYSGKVPNPVWLEWAGARTATMPTPVDDALITGEGGRATVVWTAQPDVLRYVAVLRGDGRSWHQPIATSGAAEESATFDGLPEDGAYSAEVLLAPAARGNERHLSPARHPDHCH